MGFSTAPLLVELYFVLDFGIKMQGGKMMVCIYMYTHYCYILNRIVYIYTFYIGRGSESSDKASERLISVFRARLLRVGYFTSFSVSFLLLVTCYLVAYADVPVLLIVMCSFIFLSASLTSYSRFTSTKISSLDFTENKILISNNKIDVEGGNIDFNKLMNAGEMLERARNQGEAAYNEAKMQFLSAAYTHMASSGLQQLQLGHIESIRQSVDPIISNYQLVLDLDVACAFSYSLEEIQKMYKSAGIAVDPNAFKSAFPAVHYSINHMKLDIFEFLLKKQADIDTLQDKQGRTLLDLVEERYRGGHIERKRLLDIYRIVQNVLGADMTCKFVRSVLLRHIYNKLCSGEEGELIILSREESGKYVKVGDKKFVLTINCGHIMYTPPLILSCIYAYISCAGDSRYCIYLQCQA
jgi:hypothetical protein